jgi:hypothetical protein
MKWVMPTDVPIEPIAEGEEHSSTKLIGTLTGRSVLGANVIRLNLSMKRNTRDQSGVDAFVKGDIGLTIRGVLKMKIIYAYTYHSKKLKFMLKRLKTVTR